MLAWDPQIYTTPQYHDWKPWHHIAIQTSGRLAGIMLQILTIIPFQNAFYYCQVPLIVLPVLIVFHFCNQNNTAVTEYI